MRCVSTFIGYTRGNKQKELDPMKKTPLRRKTPLKSHSTLKRKVESLSKKIFNEGKYSKKDKKKSITKSKGLFGHGRNDDHRRIHGLLCMKGCLACRILGREPATELNIHHIDGRSNGKVNDLSEYLVICLCIEHHAPMNVCGMKQNLLSVHGNKKLFIQEIGTEIWCVHQGYKLINECPPWLTNSLWEEFISLENHESEDQWIQKFQLYSLGFVPVSQNYLIENIDR